MFVWRVCLDMYLVEGEGGHKSATVSTILWPGLSFHRLSYLQVHIYVCLTSHLVAHNFLQPLKMFVVSLTKHNHPQSSSDTMHFDTQPRHLHHCSNRINISNEKPTFLLKGEGRVLNKGKALPNPYSFIYFFSFFFLRKGAPVLHLLLTLVPLSHT